MISATPSDLAPSRASQATRALRPSPTRPVIPDPFAPRDADAIAADVDRGLELRAQIQILTAELDQIEARLTADALSHPDEHELLKDETRTGRRYTAVGTSHLLPVVLTADKLLSQFRPDTPQESRILALCPPPLLDAFYAKITIYSNQLRDGKTFRARASALLGPTAPAFVNACLARDKDGLPKNDIKIDWHSATVHAAV